MNIIWLIILGAIIWYFWRQKNAPEDQIKKLEALAYEQYFVALNHAKKDVEIQENRNKEKSIIPAEHGKEFVKLSKDRVKHIEKIEEMFVRLKARMKHRPAKEQLEIYSDFYTYSLDLNRLERRFEQLGYDFSETAHEDYEADTKDIKIEMNEIERRFEQRLK